MNDDRFDHLTLSFAATSLSRQQALKTFAAGVLSGLAAALGNRSAAAQPDCSETGSGCRKDAHCCSDICSRKRRCKCKTSGQSCSEPRNCCSEKCCNSRCCGDLQTCENGQCVCDELLYETCGTTCCPLLTQECRNGACCTPCGSACCPSLTHECRNDTCCKQVGVACRGNAQCCSGQCRNGRCTADRCEDVGDCRSGEQCCQGKCVPCPQNGQCLDDGTCGCPGVWCPPSENFAEGVCCVGCSTGCCPTAGAVGACICCVASCDPLRDCGGFGPGTPAKPYPQQ